MPRPIALVSLALATLATSGCFLLFKKPVARSFSPAFGEAQTAAKAWAPDAQLYYFGAAALDSAGAARWTFKFLSATKAAEELIATDDTGKLSTRIAPLDGEPNAGDDPAAAARAFAAWDKGSDSPAWIAEAGWAARLGIAGTLIARVNRCDGPATDCAPDAEPGAVLVNLWIATDAAVERDPKAIELGPTHRAVTLAATAPPLPDAGSAGPPDAAPGDAAAPRDAAAPHDAGAPRDAAAPRDAGHDAAH